MNSPLPWKKEARWHINDANGRQVAGFGSMADSTMDPIENAERKEANTDLTLRSVNAHPAVVALLGTVSRVFPDTYQGKEAKRLLKQLGGNDG